MLEASLDYETRSLCSLKKLGAGRYSCDPSTEILCFSVAPNVGETKIWVPKKWRYIVQGRLPLVSDAEVRQLSHPDTVVSAFNASFEISITDALFTKTTGMPAIGHKQWRCVAVMARMAALPSKLEKLAQILKLKHQKDAKGAGLIKKFSIPNPRTKKFTEPDEDPEAFVEFCSYCIQDSNVEREAKQLLRDFSLTGMTLRGFQADIEINSRGFPVNLDALHKATKLVEAESGRLSREFESLTGLRPTQGKKLLPWLQARGYKGTNLKAETLDEYFDEEGQPNEDIEDDDFDPLECSDSELLHKVLTLKRYVGFASIKKIKAMIACAGPHDNRVRWTLIFHGAGTGRWTASLVQPQNFKKPVPYMEAFSEAAYKAICAGCSNEWLEMLYGPPLEVIASCIRHFIQDDKPMLDADYASIEARLMAWQTQEQWRLDVFNTHGMIYEASACQMFGLTMQDFKDYKKVHGKPHPLRQKGKFGELSLQYMGYIQALINMGATKQGLTEEELPELVKVWRAASPNFKKHWDSIRDAAIAAIKCPNTKFPFGIRCAFMSTTTAGMRFLFMVLPSGRKIAYPQPEVVPQIAWSEDKVELVEEVDPNTGEIRHVEKVVKGLFKRITDPSIEQILAVREKWPQARMSEAVTFFGKLPKKQAWGRIATHQGVFCNNQIQGEAADTMIQGLVNCEDEGYEICALIHDEALSAYHPEKGQTLEEFVALLTKLPAWAEGMPLKAEGDVVKFYKK